jgi:hypothetical protein
MWREKASDIQHNTVTIIDENIKSLINLREQSPALLWHLSNLVIPKSLPKIQQSFGLPTFGSWKASEYCMSACPGCRGLPKF